MKLSIFIDKERDEEVIVYAHEENEFVRKIRSLSVNEAETLLGYNDTEVIKFEPQKTECFITENNRVYALTDYGKLKLKERLYQLESTLPDCFIKINQSCICNINKIQKFDVSFSGSLTVVFASGYCDYVSRRNIKKVKERLGL